jgi:uncharacterized protein YbdZ (MbtH family)/predicted MFS family arabinose efflux permease
MIPLRRNRDYQLLWSGQALSLLGFNASTIAFPLLALAVSGSAAVPGLVLGAVAAAQLLAGLPGGALVDRLHRKTIMLATEAAQAIAAASVVVAIWLDALSIGQLIAVAAVVGVCAALFEPAEDASLPHLVAAEQLPAAVALNSARGYLGQLVGTGAGGFLFAAARFAPFAVDAVAHVLAFGTIAFVRLPPRSLSTVEQGNLGRAMLDGLRWVWGQRLIRVTTLCAVALNVFFAGYYVVVLVVARSSGVAAGQIGLMAAMLGVGGLAGALLAPLVNRYLHPYGVLVGVFVVLTVLTPVAAFVHSGYALGALFFAMALLPPAANTTIVARQLLLTPDELRGRLTGVLGLAMGVSAAVGPLLGSALLAVRPGPAAVLGCAAGIAVVTLLVMLSPTLRQQPREMSTLDTPGERTAPMDDDARYEVLRNDEDQYSLWLLGHEVPPGWHRVGKEGTKDECSAYVDEVWTDMRPRSLRERMDAQS